MPVSILILGGYGNTGRALARRLLQETEAQVVVAGRRRERAEQFAAALNAEFEGGRAQGFACDASDPGSLRAAMNGQALIAVASSTSPFTREIAETALQAGIDYLDVQYSSAKLAVLHGMEGRIRKAGRCFITDAGFHPGLPAALVRWAGRQFDRLETAFVGSVIKIDWARLQLSPATVEEMVSEFAKFQALSYRQGAWRAGGGILGMELRAFDFGPPFGQQRAFPMMLEEMRDLPTQYPTLRETGFFVGGFNWFVDWLVSPAVMLVLKLAPRRGLRPASQLFEWGLRRFSAPPFGIVLLLVAAGVRDGSAKEILLAAEHLDGYEFTAIPVAACLKQYLDGSIRRPGLWLMGQLVEPERLLSDVERMGVRVSRRESRVARATAR